MKYLLKPGYYYWPTTLLHTPSVFFMYLFSLKKSMISNKNVGCDGLITFWKKPCYPSFIPSLQPIIMWLLNFFGTTLLFQSWAKSYFIVGQLQQPFISKWGKCYFKVGQRQLFQSRSIISKWGKNYVKVGQLFQKWGSYCKVGHNRRNMIHTINVNNLEPC